MRRTTLILDEVCLKGIKDLARKEDRNVSEVVRTLLAEGLQRRKVRRRQEFEIPTFSIGEASSEPRRSQCDRSTHGLLMVINALSLKQ
jgi:Arc/MetJ-type ribon-helix-helix transcriptional regulator